MPNSTQQTATERLAAMGLELPPAAKPMGLYRPVIVTGGVAYLSGHGPLQMDGTLTTGRIGACLCEEEGYAAARQTALAMLSTLIGHFGSLEPITRLVKTVGMIQCTPEFFNVPGVINGFSEMMRDVFGEENGIAARSAVGMNSLPAGMAVEVEAIFEVKE